MAHPSGARQSAIPRRRSGSFRGLARLSWPDLRRKRYIHPALGPGDRRDRQDRRSLQDHREDRRRRHGRGVSRERLPPGPRRGAEDPAGGVREGSGPHGALPARSAGARPAQPPEHRRHPRTGEGGGVLRPGARAGGGADARGPHPLRTDPPGRRAPDRAADRRGDGGRARAGDHPPRPQAGEREAHAGGKRQGPRLRSREGARRRPGGAVVRGDASERLPHPDLPRPVRRADGSERHPRHRGVHVAGAGAGQAGRPPVRHLELRRRAVRDAQRAEALRREDGVRHARDGAAAGAGLGTASTRRAALRATPVAALPPEGRAPAPAGDRRRPHRDRGARGERPERRGGRSRRGRGGRAAAPSARRGHGAGHRHRLGVGALRDTEVRRAAAGARGAPAPGGNPAQRQRRPRRGDLAGRPDRGLRRRPRGRSADAVRETAGTLPRPFPFPTATRRRDRSSLRTAGGSASRWECRDSRGGSRSS